jgi:hypothetical protein
MKQIGSLAWSLAPTIILPSHSVFENYLPGFGPYCDGMKWVARLAIVVPSEEGIDLAGGNLNEEGVA